MGQCSFGRLAHDDTPNNAPASTTTQAFDACRSMMHSSTKQRVTRTIRVAAAKISP
jgi:hypothetical protein